MFGINDSNKNNAQPAQSDATASAAPSPNLAGSEPVGSPNPAQPVITPLSSQSVSTPPATSDSSSPTDSPTSSSGGLKDVNLERAYMTNDPSGPADTSSSEENKSDSTDTPQPAASSLVNAGHEDGLIKLKQQALQNLAPLVDHLDQTPEEKFKTTMMLIQASDNADLVQEAYDAANKITDEKARAQALLDVVNEINYFTQHQQNDDSAS